MKKILRILLICAGVFLLLLVIALVAAFQPSVQTWAARKAVAGMPGTEISIGRVNAGLNKVELTGIRVKSAAGVVDLPSASVEMPLLGVIREKVSIKKIVAKGWTVDLAASVATAPDATQKQTAPAQKSATPGNGIFDMLKLPVDLTIDEADIEGIIKLPPEKAGEPQPWAGVVIRGGQLKPDSDGVFKLSANMLIPAKDAPVSAIKVDSLLTVQMDTPRTIQSLVCDTNAGASGRQLPQGAALSARIAASRTASGEDYALNLKSQTPGAEKNLMSVKAANPAGEGGFNATWAVDIRDTDIKPFVQSLGLPIPALTANGQGTLEADDAFEKIHAGGKLTADVGNPEVIAPELSGIGRIHFNVDFDVVREGDIVRVSAFSVDAASADAPVASVKALQLIEYDTASGDIKVPDTQSDLVRVDVHGLPLAWAQPFLQSTGIAVGGGPLRGSLTAKAKGTDVSVRSVTPFTLSGLEVSQDKKTLANNLTVAVAFAADHTNRGWNATVSNFQIQSAGRTLVEMPQVKVSAEAAAAGAAQAPVSLMGLLRIDFSALLAQPAAADFRVLSAGAAEVEFSGRLEEKLKKIAAKISVAGLRSNNQKELPKISADLRADLYADGHGDVQAPLLFELNSRKTDIDLTASIKPDGARQNIDASISSNEIHVEDMMAFSSLAPAQTQAASPQTGGPSPGPETAAPWDSITGQVKFLLKKVVYAPDVQADNVSGAIKISPSLLSLENFRALPAGSGELKADGSLKFDAKAAGAPYSADAKVSAADFDPAPFLKAANPGKKPMVEGKFDVSGAASGTSASLAGIASAIGADLNLVSRGGKFHGFETSAAAANLGKVQKGASTVAAIGGALLSALGKSDNAAIADKIRAGSDVVGRLIDMNFDQMNIEASYRPGTETVIKNFSILSPDMRLTSSGSFGNDSKLSWARQAVKLVAQMAVRGDQAKDLGTLGLLKKEADSLGFTPLLENFPIEGSISSLTTDALFKNISAKLAK